MTEQARAVLVVLLAAVVIVVALFAVPPGLSGESDPCRAWLDRNGTPNEHC